MVIFESNLISVQLIWLQQLATHLSRHY